MSEPDPITRLNAALEGRYRIPCRGNAMTRFFALALAGAMMSGCGRSDTPIRVQGTVYLGAEPLPLVMAEVKLFDPVSGVTMTRMISSETGQFEFWTDDPGICAYHITVGYDDWDNAEWSGDVVFNLKRDMAQPLFETPPAVCAGTLQAADVRFLARE